MEEITKIMRRLGKLCKGNYSQFEIDDPDSDGIITLKLLRTSPEEIQMFYEQNKEGLKNRKDALKKFNAAIEKERKKFEPEELEKQKEQFEKEVLLQRKKFSEAMSKNRENMNRLRPYYKKLKVVKDEKKNVDEINKKP